MSKLILSRKGFDASDGGAPSPILADGRLFSLPIPCQHSPMTYDDLALRGHSVGQLVQDLTRGRIRGEHCAHLDPDLRPGIYPRLEGWRPLFGQAGAAQAHLASQGVGVGDLFLFFGWFRQAECYSGRYRYVKNAPDLHVVYGWLRVGEVLDLAGRPDTAPAWAAYHPHCHGRRQGPNVLYVAARGGALEHYDQRLCLTAPGAGRSLWRLPSWVCPQGRPPLTYHGDPKRWIEEDERHVLLRTAARGQEFVLDTAQYPQALAWARDVIGEAT